MKQNQIPKVIHYCWFGNSKKSKLILKCIASWKKHFPDYEIIEWNESNFDIHMNSYVEEAYIAKKWAFVADYARLWVIYNYGGIYFDTDVEIIKKFDYLGYDAFFCMESENFIATGLGFGARKDNYLIKKMLDDYNDIHFNLNGNYDLTACPVRNTRSISKFFEKMKNRKKIFVFDNIAIFPPDYFCPLEHSTGIMNKTENTVAIHWYSGAWLSNSKKIKIKIHRLLVKVLGKELFNSINNKIKKKVGVINERKK